MSPDIISNISNYLENPEISELFYNSIYQTEEENRRRSLLKLLCAIESLIINSK